MVINIFAAVGFTITGSIIRGLIEYGGWLFFILAVFGIFHTIFNNIEEPDALLHVIKKFASIMVAVGLFYFPVQIAMNDVIAGSTGTTVKKAVDGNSILSSMHDFSTGSLGLVNGITYLAYQISSGLPTLAAKIAGTSDTDLWPGVQSAIDTDLSSAMQSNDPQIAANIAQWKNVLAPAILKSDPKLATALQANPQLAYVFANPYSTNSQTDPDYGKLAAKVKSLLKSDPPNPSWPELVAQQQTQLAGVADKLGSVVPFTAGTSSSSKSSTPTYVNVKLFSKKYWKLNQDISTYDKVHNTVTPVTSWTSEAYAWLPNLIFKQIDSKKDYKEMRRTEEGTPTQAIASDLAVDVEDYFGGKKTNDPTQKFTSLSDLYQNLGRSVLVASVAGYARNPKNVAAMQAMCATHGDEACAQTLQMFANQIRRPKDVVGHTPGVSSWLGKTLADLGSFTITGLIEVVVYSIGTLFNTAAPYIIGLSMTAAILVSVIGPFWMLIAGRFMHAMEWMALPVILVNLWDALYIIWLIVCDGLDGIIPHLANNVNNYGSSSMMSPNIGIVSNPALMNHIVNIFEAMGFLAIPTIAYMLLFGKAGDGMRNNFGSSMARATGAAATMAAMVAMRAGRKGGKSSGKTPGKTTAPGGNTPGTGGGLTPSNPVKGGGVSASAPKATGGVPSAPNNTKQNIGAGGGQSSAKTASGSTAATDGAGDGSNSGTNTQSSGAGRSQSPSQSSQQSKTSAVGQGNNVNASGSEPARQGNGPSVGRQGSGPGGSGPGGSGPGAVRQSNGPSAGRQGNGPGGSGPGGSGPGPARQGNGPSAGRQGNGPGGSGPGGSGPGPARQGNGPSAGRQGNGPGGSGPGGSGPGAMRQGNGPSAGRQGNGPGGSGPGPARQGNGPSASRQGSGPALNRGSNQARTRQGPQNSNNQAAAQSKTAPTGGYNQSAPTSLRSMPPKKSR
ncbi:hypothetical protein [Acidithiobacillus marinus]|nr:hypothetical protein [Acidithiobacillus marinus]